MYISNAAATHGYACHTTSRLTPSPTPKWRENASSYARRPKLEEKVPTKWSHEDNRNKLEIAYKVTKWGGGGGGGYLYGVLRNVKLVDF
jgi:hypothetical protein